MTPSLRAWLLLAPAGGVYALLMVGPLILLARESLKRYVPGRIGGADDGAVTLANYLTLVEPAYLYYFLDTFRIGLIVSFLGVALGYPIAYYIARKASRAARRLWIASLIAWLFLSVIVRLYAILLTYGPVGALKNVSWAFGLSPAAPGFVEVQVAIGLLHVVLPLCALTLIGTVQNVNPSLEDAAQTLGAPRWAAFFNVTVALSMPGIVSAFLIAYAFCISNFVVPLILGKGIVLFVSNLIYIRFSEVANFPGGAAIAIVMLILSVFVVYGLTSLLRSRWQTS